MTVLHEGSVLAEGLLSDVQANEKVVEVYLEGDSPEAPSALPPRGAPLADRQSRIRAPLAKPCRFFASTD